MRANANVKFSVTLAPTPALSPGERENRSPTSSVAPTFRSSFISRSEHRSVAKDRLIVEQPRTADGCPLSSGERVRLRASVITNF